MVFEHLTIFQSDFTDIVPQDNYLHFMNTKSEALKGEWEAIPFQMISCEGDLGVEEHRQEKWNKVEWKEIKGKRYGSKKLTKEWEGPDISVGIIKWQRGLGLWVLWVFLKMAFCTLDDILDHFKIITIIRWSGQRWWGMKQILLGLVLNPGYKIASCDRATCANTQLGKPWELKCWRRTSTCGLGYCQEQQMALAGHRCLIAWDTYAQRTMWHVHYSSPDAASLRRCPKFPNQEKKKWYEVWHSVSRARRFLIPPYMFSKSAFYFCTSTFSERISL